MVFEHSSVASLRRELLRNGQLRQLCGFDPVLGAAAVPPARAYTRFMGRLIEQEEEITQLFDGLLDRLKEALPDLGEVLAVDGKELHSRARGPSKKVDRDGRRETDADWGVKTAKGTGADGQSWQKVKSWFGFTIHLVVDATYELPVGFEVTKASAGEQPVAHRLPDRLQERHQELLERCQYFAGDRGYDDGKLVRRVWDEHRIKPVIDIRNCWRDGEQSKLVTGQENVVYSYDGEVSCICPKTGTERDMCY